VPREIVYDIAWPHPARLPLGAGWKGSCCAQNDPAPAGSVADARSNDIDPALIRDFCNLGYATSCPRLPRGRDWDAIRFSVASSSSAEITLCYICELAHAPKAHGTLTYDLVTEAWRDAPGATSEATTSDATTSEATRDVRVRRLAASYLQAYRARQSGASA